MPNHTDQQVEDLISSVYLFSGLDKRPLRALLKQGKIVEHPAGKTIVTEGDEEGFAFHLVLDGELAVTVHGEERRRLHPGQYFGEIALIDGHRRSASVATVTPATTWALSRWNFRAELDRHPEIAVALLHGMCARLREAEILTG